MSSRERGSGMGSRALLKVTARRRYRASPEVLFRAFSRAEDLIRWFSPSEEIQTEVVDLDFRPGGRYRFAFHFPDGGRNLVTGRYEEISPRRLVFTWTWEEPDPHAGIDTRVTIEFIELGEGTEVLVTHERFPDRETRDRHDEGWSGALTRLLKLLET